MINFKSLRLAEDNTINCFAYVILLTIIGLTWYYSTYYVDLLIAWGGWSPIHWIYNVHLPENFSLDFENGVGNYKNSLIMYSYEIAYTYFAISPEIFLLFFMGAEILIITIAFVYLTKTIYPQTGWEVIIFVVLIAIASGAKNMNIAGFGQPSFMGLYYSFADAFRILAIACILKKQYWWVAIFLFLSFASHPTMGIMAMIFVFAMLFTKKEVYKETKFVRSFIFFITIVGIWSVMVLLPGINSSVGIVPHKEWINLSRFCTYHWYPFDMGVFTNLHNYVLIPFISFTILYLHYLNTKNNVDDKDKQLLAGIITMFCLVILGVIFSFTLHSATLIKLSLHRANDLILIVGLIYIVQGLWNDVKSEGIGKSLIALGILFSPLLSLSLPGFPILMTYMLLIISYKKYNIANLNLVSKAVLIIVISSIVLLGYYYTAGWMRISGSFMYDIINFFNNYGNIWTLPRFVKINSLFINIFCVITFVFVIFFRKNKWCSIFLVITALLCGNYWAESRYILPVKPEVSKYYAYKQTQIWARDNTAQNALFMVDPTIYYGWRDYSRRSSFGNMREWLYSSWAYNSNYDLYKEGLKRTAEFTDDLSQYTKDHSPYGEGYKNLNKKIHNDYYNRSDEWRLDLANRYNISYFVMEKKYITNEPNLKLVYENEYFKVFKGAN